MSGFKEEYELSGSMGGSMVPVMGGGLISAVVLGFIYGYACAYNPLAGILTILLTAGYGFAMGFILSKLGHMGKCRNMKFMGLMGALIGGFSLYISWAVFLFALIGKSTDEPISLMAVMSSPVGVWDIMGGIAETGWFSISSFTPSGMVLWGLWGIEALLVVGMSGVIAMGEDGVFCESCNRWTAPSQTINFKPPVNDNGELQMDLFSDLNRLNTIERAEAGEALRLALESHCCSECASMGTWQLKLKAMTTNDEGKTEEKSEDLTPRYLLGPENIQELKTLLT